MSAMADKPDWGLTPGRPPAWFVAVLDAEAALRRDDDQFAQAARREAQAVIDQIGAANARARCPDPALFDAFVLALGLWAGRGNPVERERVRGVVISAMSALHDLPRERQRIEAAHAALAPIERGLTVADR
jgi:hypothetical protein